METSLVRTIIREEENPAHTDKHVMQHAHFSIKDVTISLIFATIAVCAVVTIFFSYKIGLQEPFVFVSFQILLARRLPPAPLYLRSSQILSIIHLPPSHSEHVR